MPARDVFICHASTDKAAYARPLAELLTRRNLSCWIDEAEIRLGEGIFDAINDGLRLARYVAVLVTEDFLSRDWVARELAAAFNLEVERQETVILPLLAVDAALWKRQYPLLADKRFIRLDEDLDAVADEIASLFERSAQRDWAFHHPQRYTGPVWTRIASDFGTTVPSVHLTLRWGPFIKSLDVDLSGGPVSLIHHKLKEDVVPLHVECEPPAVVTVGQGPAPDPRPRAIPSDEGWTRAAGMPVIDPLPMLIEPLPHDRTDLADLLGEPDEESDQ